MPHKGQLPELVRHVHAVAHDEFIRAIKADVIAGDVGGEVAWFVQQHATLGPLGPAGHDQVFLLRLPVTIFTMSHLWGAVQECHRYLMKAAF